jgi:hypothetical protein
MGPTVCRVVTCVNSVIPSPYAAKRFLTTTSLFKQINPNSADCYHFAGQAPALTRTLLTFQWINVPEIAELPRHSLPEVRKFKSLSRTHFLAVDPIHATSQIRESTQNSGN